MYGELRGTIGQSMSAIPALELDDDGAPAALGVANDE
jgi:hypothetical protein